MSTMQNSSDVMSTCQDRLIAKWTCHVDWVCWCWTSCLPNQHGLSWHNASCLSSRFIMTNIIDMLISLDMAWLPHLAPQTCLSKGWSNPWMASRTRARRGGGLIGGPYTPHGNPHYILHIIFSTYHYHTSQDFTNRITTHIGLLIATVKGTVMT